MVLESFDGYPTNIVPHIDEKQVEFELGENNSKLMADWHIVKDNISEIIICEGSRQYVNSEEATIGNLFVYRLERAPGEEEHIDEDDAEIAACQTWMLPNRAFFGLWESLHFSSRIKEDLLQYCITSFLFSKMNVNRNLINWNKVILFHGPPGTGKTSIAQALAQKIAIRGIGGFKHTALIEINSHSLFSKWFSESGKLVQKMFSKIREYADDDTVMTIILIDEVESLTAARSSSSNEPADAIRVVNAVLTQLDSLKKYPNVLVVCTSNITGRIDLAFIDRADMKIYMGPPKPTAIYSILYSAISELHKKNVLSGELDLRDAMSFDSEKGASANEITLGRISREAEGVSGRTLRKIPFLAMMKFCNGQSTDVEAFLDAIEKAIAADRQERKDLSDGEPKAKRLKEDISD